MGTLLLWYIFKYRRLFTNENCHEGVKILISAPKSRFSHGNRTITVTFFWGEKFPFSFCLFQLDGYLSLTDALTAQFKNMYRSFLNKIKNISHLSNTRIKKKNVSLKKIKSLSNWYDIESGTFRREKWYVMYRMLSERV